MRTRLAGFWIAGIFCFGLVGCSADSARSLLAQTTATPAPTAVNRTPEEATQPTTEAATSTTAILPEIESVTPLPQAAVERLTDQPRIISNVYNRVAPAVVQITPGQGLGSGFLIDDEGHIVTNYHVIAPAQGGRVLVSFTGLFQTVGQVIGTDPSSDLAVVKVDEVPENVTPVTLGDLSQVSIGDMVIAIGNPLGQERTVTNGIVSAIGRTINEPQNPYAIGGAIQTDAAINPGNSGGPLLNASGQVVGVNTAILSPSGASAGIGFAIPVNLVKKVVPELIAEGQYEHPWLGVRIIDEVTTYEARQQGLPTAGILLQANDTNSPLRIAGLEESVILTAINDMEITSAADVISYLELNTSPGETVTLQVTGQNGEERAVRVELGARPSVTDITTTRQMP